MVTPDPATPLLPERVTSHDAVLLYDGLCGFCDGTVRWLLRRSSANTRAGQIYFLPQQSELAQAILKKHGLPTQDSHRAYLLVHPGTPRERILQGSAAILRATAMLRGVWLLLATLAGVLPRSLRDAVYAAIARNRYKIAGKRTECRIPAPEERPRFLGF